MDVKAPREDARSTRAPAAHGPAGKRGRKLADRRVAIDRPHAPFFRYADEGQLVARESASAPRTRAGRQLARVRSVLFGRPLSIHEEITERLSKTKALAIFSSDPISSSAYATEEILRVLVLAGTGALLLSLPIAAAIAVLLAVVSTSYRQIGYAYPSGGGAYAVARANLPAITALVAAAALLVDYVMTVAVSTASAVEQVISAVPSVADGRLVIGIGAIVLITIGNLRGLRESGNIFALPTYLFVGSSLLMIAVGFYRIFVNGESGTVPAPLPGAPDPLQPLGLLLILRAFASGSVALTGTEAIANGVPAFKRPEPRNAATTLTAVAILLGILFIGITVVADTFGIVPIDEPTPRTVISQVAATIYGQGSIGFYLFQTFTALVLFLAANTSYNAFPRLAAILARDGYMPRVAKAPTSLLVAVVIPILVAGMLFIHRQYARSAAQLSIPEDVVIPRPTREDRIVVPVAGLDRAVVQAVNIGRSIGPDVRGVVIADDPPAALRLREDWDRHFEDVPLDIIEVEVRALAGPMLAYLDWLDESTPAGVKAPMTFVIVPEFVPRHWWERGLYNQSAKAMRAALIGRPHTVVVDMAYRREGPRPRHRSTASPAPTA